MTQTFQPRHALLLAALAAAFSPLAQGATAARIDFVSGNVVAQSADGSRRELSKGSNIAAGERVLTNDGRAQMRFTDGAMVSLKPGSEFLVEEYRFNGQTDGEERGVFSLLKGGMRTITGWIGRTDREKYRVNTVTATIGIRGTEYSVTYGNSINVNTAEGIVEVCNPAGCLLLYPGDEGYVAGENIEPVLVQTGEDRPRKYDDPPEWPHFEAPANDRDANGVSAALANAAAAVPTPPPNVLLFGLIDDNFNVNQDIFGSGSLIQRSALDPGVASITAPEGALQLFTTALGVYSTTGVIQAVGSTIDPSIMSWGRWVADTTILNEVVATPVETTFGQSILHYVVGQPSTLGDVAALPSALYSMIGFSANNQTGNSFFSSGGSMDVSFSSLQVNSLQISFTDGFASNYQINGAGYAINTTNGLSFAGTGAVLSGPSVVGPCTSCSSANISGAFFGPGASHAGASFNFTDAGTGVAGIAAFQQGVP